MLSLILPWWAKWAALGVLMLACAAFGAWWMHAFGQARYDALARDFSEFKAKVETEGNAARLRAQAQADNDLKRKRIADADLKNARAAAADAFRGWMQLAQSRAVGGYLPAPAPTAASPARACVNRSEFERAMGELDQSGARIAAAGDSCRVDLDAAKRWAESQ